MDKNVYLHLIEMIGIIQGTCQTIRDIARDYEQLVPFIEQIEETSSAIRQELKNQQA